MSRYGFDDVRGPWSLFLPATLAVMVGMLGAQGIGWAIGVIFADRNAAMAIAPSPVPAAGASPMQPDAMRLPADDPSATTAQPAVAQPLPVSGAGDTPAAVGDASSQASSQPYLSAMPPARTTSPAAVSAQSGESERSAVDPDAERLQGPLAARRDGDPRACINGTVAVRSDNGWQQELSSDRPVRCSQSMP